MLTPEELEKIKRLAPQPGTSTSRFAPKLTSHQRHQAYALLRMGYTQGVVSKVFGIARATLGHMNRESSPYYRDVREAWKSMGEDVFFRRFLDMPIMDRANEYREMMKQDDVLSGPNRPNPLANKKAGWHEIAGKRYFIRFHNDPEVDMIGWTFSTEGPEDIYPQQDVMEPTSGAALKKMHELEKEGCLF
jgi:hypothetical protein